MTLRKNVTYKICYEITPSIDIENMLVPFPSNSMVVSNLMLTEEGVSISPKQGLGTTQYRGIELRGDDTYFVKDNK